MSLLLYPRAAPSDCLRVWVGAFKRTQAPLLSWFLNDAPEIPKTLRPISSVRPDNMLPAGESPANVQRAFTGVYEFQGLTPDTFYRLRVNADGIDSPTLETRTLPDSVPRQLDRSFNVLLVSCFHSAEDRGGLAGTIVSQLKATSKPHLTILAGDQVYLDLPTLKDFPDQLSWLANKFEEDYTRNWSDRLAYAEVLGAAPSVSCPDDHEYWNNYPHVSPFISNSRTTGGQDRWRAAAQEVYKGFQLAYPADLGDPVTLDVKPLSFFFADTRTYKDADHRFTMKSHARKQLDDWVTHVIDDKLFGVIVSGQSLFSKPAGRVTGAVGDYDLANYGDYGEIMHSLQRFANSRRPLLCLTGDVHWGRVATTRDIRTGRTAFAEVISSPASLVATVGSDQGKRLISAIGGLFGEKNPWPRHSDPATLPAFLASEVFSGSFPCSWVHGQRGNHVVMLHFRQHGNGLELRIKYWPISIDSKVGKPADVGPIDLISG
jgi:hypothetical protein